MKIQPWAKMAIPIILGIIIVKVSPHIYRVFSPYEKPKGIYTMITSSGEVTCKNDENGTAYCLNKDDKLPIDCRYLDYKNEPINGPVISKKCDFLKKIILEDKELAPPKKHSH